MEETPLNSLKKEKSLSKTKPSLTAIVLTFNEEIHLQRCLDSLVGICERIVVVDSFSNDDTKKIATKCEIVDFFENPWINHSFQMNWAIANTNINSDWVIRIDADEYVTEKLSHNINKHLPNLSSDINGILINRLMYFFGKPLKKAGMYPIKHLKLWRKGTAICELKWMDERMKLFSGDVTFFEGDIVDHNLNKLSWWTNKHNNYATREAIDILNQFYNFTGSQIIKGNLLGSSEERRRWFKERYLKLPLFIRPILFWFIRYFIQGGFLEGKRGFIWNFLQCGWYRFLVDAKIYEAYKYGGKDKESLKLYFKQEYGYDVTKIN